MASVIRPEQAMSGIALVSVLWVLVLFSLMAAALAGNSRLDAGIASNLRQSAQLDLVAESGMQWAFWGLSVPEPQIPWLADGSVYAAEDEGVLLQVAVQDENGKIDINLANEVILQRLFEAVVIDSGQAQALTNAVLDWRDEDDFQRINGAEDIDYESAGFDYGASDKPFNSIEELRLVMGMTDEIYAAISTAVTIHSGKQLVNPLVAPRLVLLALSDHGEGDVDQYIERRRELHRNGQQPVPGELTSIYFSTGQNAVNYTVHVQAEVDVRARSGLAAVVRRQGRQGQRIFKILTVRRQLSTLFRQEET